MNNKENLNMNTVNLMLEKLIQKISAANLAYSQDMPIYTDTEYDKLWQQLFKLDPENPVLYHTTNNPNYSNVAMHKYQIYGTQKAFNTDDLRPFLTRFGSDQLVFEPKYDGCAAVFYRGQTEEENKLILSGDGIKGQDVSQHLPKIKSTFGLKNMVSCELVIPWKTWNSDFGANPRNVVSGWAQRDNLDPNLASKISVAIHDGGYLSEPYLFTGDFDHLNEKLLSCYHQWSKIYPLDGIMIKVFDEEKRLIVGHSSTYYHWSIAWKPPMQTKKTTVTDIKWKTSRSGRVVPTVCYEPISLCGTTNSKATGNNAKWIKDRDLNVGSEIVVGKAGEIIPKILDVQKPPQKTPSDKRRSRFTDVPSWADITAPTADEHALNTPKINCPTCASSLSWKGVDLICTSPRCIAQLIQSIQYFYSDKGVDLKSIGEFMLGDILEQPKGYHVLSKHPYALLDPETFNLVDLLKKHWGEKRYQTYRDNLNNLHVTPINFIAALGYDKLAYKSVLKLWYFVFENQPIKGVSKTAQQNFSEAYLTYQIASVGLKNFTFDPVPPVPKITYCITGKLSCSRSEMIAYLNDYGWAFSNQVSRYVDILILGDEPGKTKTRKAKELNTLVISEDEITDKLK